VIVAGKSVRIVESHEEVLGDWADAARRVGRPLTLVTLDRHLDTTPALTAGYSETGAGEGLVRWSERVLSRYRGASPDALEELVARLQNDEHIDAALRLGIVARALIISSQMGRTGDSPVGGVSVFRPVCAPGCASVSHVDAGCERRRYDTMLEPTLLRPALAHLGLDVDSGEPYVLDIDLDAFSTRKSLDPADASVFHALIAGAHSVTIAREPEYVNESLDDHDADEIEAAVVCHIRRAMDGSRSSQMCRG
jgi:hypothetical protein